MRVATYESNRVPLTLVFAAVASSFATIAMLVVVPALLEESRQDAAAPHVSAAKPLARDTQGDTADAHSRVEHDHRHEERT